jgi:DtxR family transcriptional regulator, Mn-dependent transcriptional regulator
MYLLAARGGEAGAVAIGEVARALAVVPSTASCIFKSLAESALATHTPYEGRRLTREGERPALTILRRHPQPGPRGSP